jgi:hypothetical protein
VATFRSEGKGVAMRARRIIEGSAFGPEVIRTASEAFEAAWNEIADRIDPGSHEEAREALATAIIAATREDSSDAEVLRGAGLRAMARIYPDRLPPHLDDKTQGTGSK